MLGGGVCGRMPKHFRDLKKMLVGGGGGCYAQIFYRLEKMLGGGVCQQIYGLENVGGGGEGYAQIFPRLENCWGGGTIGNSIDYIPLQLLSLHIAGYYHNNNSRLLKL